MRFGNLRLLHFLSGLLLAAIIVASGGSAFGQATPASITGTWRIVKILPTNNTGCWDADQAKALIGTTLVYAPHSMTWKDQAVPVPEALTRTLSRAHFQAEYKVDLAELGIRAPSVTEVDLQHEDADITGATTEVPGDTVVLAGPGRIVISACGIFYEAVRSGRPAGR